MNSLCHTVRFSVSTFSGRIARFIVTGAAALVVAGQLPAASTTPAVVAPVVPAAESTTPDEREFGEVMQLLKSRYADPAAIADNKLGNAALNGMLNRLGGGAILLTQPSLTTASPRPISTELLPGKIGYWRLATFKPAKDWTQMEAQLADWQKAGALGLILDLRDFESTNDYSGAARVASIFTAPGSTLFTVQGLQIPQQLYGSTNTGSRRQFDLPLVVLTNRRTMGAAEALAAVLRSNARAILVGRSTAGQAAYFTEAKLNSGRYLRLATGQAILADGTQLFGKPIVPDIALYIDDQNERMALEENNQGAASRQVQELPGRARTSEAALVHGDSPELDEFVATQLAERKTDAEKNETPLQDVALIRAMDVLRSIQFAQSQSSPRDVLTSKK